MVKLTQNMNGMHFCVSEVDAPCFGLLNIKLMSRGNSPSSVSFVALVVFIMAADILLLPLRFNNHCYTGTAAACTLPPAGLRLSCPLMCFLINVFCHVCDLVSCQSGSDLNQHRCRSPGGDLTSALSLRARPSARLAASPLLEQTGAASELPHRDSDREVICTFPVSY